MYCNVSCLFNPKKLDSHFRDEEKSYRSRLPFDQVPPIYGGSIKKHKRNDQSPLA